MNYAEFKAAYNDAFTRMVSYKVGEVGSDFYADKLAQLSDAHPDFESQLESEMESAQAA